MNQRYPFFLLGLLLYLVTIPSVSAEPKIAIKAVVVSMFESGEHTDDRPGEMQFWVERGNFDERLDFPLGMHDLYYRKDGVLLTCTGGEANFMTTNMEDNGTLTALHRMSRTGLVDTERILVLRTASNFSTPPPGEEAVWSTTAHYPADSIPAKEAAYKVENTVLEALLADWKKFQKNTPSI